MAGGAEPGAGAPGSGRLCGGRVYERTAIKLGAERALHYVHLEAGHAAQNVLLEAVALGLGAVPIGAFDDIAMQGTLGLPAEQQPLYVIPVGQLRQ